MKKRQPDYYSEMIEKVDAWKELKQEYSLTAADQLKLTEYALLYNHDNSSVFDAQSEDLKLTIV